LLFSVSARAQSEVWGETVVDYNPDDGYVGLVAITFMDYGTATYYTAYTHATLLEDGHWVTTVNDYGSAEYWMVAKPGSTYTGETDHVLHVSFYRPPPPPPDYGTWYDPWSYSYCGAWGCPGQIIEAGSPDFWYYMDVWLFELWVLQQELLVAHTSSEVQVPCAVPVNFRTASVQTPPNGSLVFDYTWSSSTGRQADLAACRIGESVYYPETNNPYVWPLPMVQSTPNPTVISGSGSAAGFIDTNGPPNSYQQPYSYAASFRATQRLWWTCPCYQSGDMQFFAPDISIDRRVFRDSADNLWKYQITKSERTNTVVLPNQ